MRTAQHFKQKKAQLAVTDLFVAIFVFTILITVVIFSWTVLNRQLNMKIYYDSLAFKTFQISNTLITSPGVPEVWNSNNVDVIGLASSDRVLSVDKVANFTNLTTEEVKYFFKSGASGFDFKIKNLQGTTLVRYSNNITNEISSIARRFVMYNGEKAVMELTLHA